VSVLVVGSLNMDLVVTMKRFPKSGETVTAEDLTLVPGGKGLNQAVAAARLVSNVSFFGAVGTDGYADTLQAALIDAGADISYLQKVVGSSGVALIEVEESGNNRISIVPGANKEFVFDQSLLQKVKDSNYSVLLAPLENPILEVEESFRVAKEAGMNTILNPAPYQHLNSKFLSLVDILIPNQHEASLMTGSIISNKEEAIPAARKLLSAGHKSVIITLGKEGAVFVSEAEVLFQEAFKVDTVDTTAAGDVFCAAFAAQISLGASNKVALKFASAAAAISTTKLGASISAPTHQAVDTYLKRFE
jgi:ribokinase